MPKIRGVLIDLDGTLSNTEDFQILYAKGAKVEDMVEYHLYEYLSPILKVITWEDFRELYIRAKKEIGKELPGTAAAHNRYLFIQRTLELCGINFAPDIIQRAVDFYWKDLLSRIDLFPGVFDALRAFKHNQLMTCLITDFTADVQIAKINKLGIMKYIDYMVTSEEAGADKPHIEQAVVALKKLKLSQEEVVVIGNNPKTDIELARRLSIKSILFDYHGYYLDQQEKADIYTRDFGDIPSLLGLKEVKYSSEKILILDFIGTITNERHVADEVLSSFVNKEKAYINAEFLQLQRRQITEAEFWYKLGVGEIEKAQKVVTASVTMRKSVVNLLRKLKESYKLVLLSDFPQKWGEIILKERGVFDLFDCLLLGGATEYMKPDKRLLEAVIEKFPKVNPENITLVDNSATALASGRDFLMQTILVDNDEYSVTAFVPDAVIGDFLQIEKVLKDNDRINH